MVAKVSTIKRKIRNNQKLGFSERARAVNKGLLPSKAKKNVKKRDPKVGTGKKPKGSDRRLYTDENPKDTVSIKYATVQDAKDTIRKVIVLISLMQERFRYSQCWSRAKVAGKFEQARLAKAAKLKLRGCTMALAKSQRSLKSWTKQKWRTKSGKPSSKTGERYLPTAAIQALSPLTTRAAGKRSSQNNRPKPRDD